MKIIKSSNGYEIKVDDEDYERLNRWRWNVHSSKRKNKVYLKVQRTIYIKKGKQRSTISMSKQIMDCPKGICIDHVNLDTLDNQKKNLRICTYTQNNWNKNKYDTNKIGLKGVSFQSSDCLREKPWFARIAVNKVTFYLGHYKTPEEAHCAYCEAAIKYHGEFANFGEKMEVKFA